MPRDLDAILSVGALKRELDIPADVSEHDFLLLDLIPRAVDLIGRITGRDLLDESEAVPEGLKAAIVVAARDMYDGTTTFPRSHAVFSLTGPYRRMVDAE